MEEHGQEAAPARERQAGAASVQDARPGKGPRKKRRSKGRGGAQKRIENGPVAPGPQAETSSGPRPAKKKHRRRPRADQRPNRAERRACLQGEDAVAGNTQQCARPQGGQAASGAGGRNGQTGSGSGNRPEHARGGRPGFKGRSAGAAAGASSGQLSHQLENTPHSSGPGTRNEAGHLATGQTVHPGAETDGAGGRGRRRRRGRGAARGAHSPSAQPAARGASEKEAAHEERAAREATRHAVAPRPQPRHDLPQPRRSGFEAGRAGEAEGDLYAALDLGTNNCRLLIAKPDERGFRVVDAYSRIVRLGEGVGASRRLSEAAMERAIEALDSCHRKLAERGVRRSRLIATEACRAAENGEEFIARVQRETGLALEIVNRETEARLAVAGCASLVDRDADGVLLFDIGGGSSEIVWLDLRNRGGARGYALTRFIRAWVSLPVGVVNLAERHGGMDVSHEVFEAMIDDVSSHLDGSALGAGLSEAMASSNMHMLGTSGTVTTLAGVHFGLRRYDRRRVDGAWLADEDVSAMVAKLRDMSYRERVENPCIGADRADLVLAGCAILEAIRRRWTCARLRVADRGLREGILTELMAADGVWSRGGRGHKGQKGRS
ncbi:Ppx/GppA phosphatase family protein [Pannonibacter sp. Pt2]|uniref:Ppx/GppA phosphatase family protein n=1 Tax=Pannonibacter anstelovis TaxID=3121537 RepID=A0ABU7ZJB6_9HYPH